MSRINYGHSSPWGRGEGGGGKSPAHLGSVPCIMLNRVSKGKDRGFSQNTLKAPPLVNLKSDTGTVSLGEDNRLLFWPEIVMCQRLQNGKLGKAKKKKKRRKEKKSDKMKAETSLPPKYLFSQMHMNVRAHYQSHEPF